MIATLTDTPKSTPSPVTEDARWALIVARDKAADGYLWYSVSTTGVYCRPSCPSRIANPGNVQLHDSLESAKATGCRPCRRCNPDGPSIEAANAALVAKACRIIEESEDEPSLQELADAIGRSPSYFHRVFKAITGLTPKEYAAGHRAVKLRQTLASGNTVTEAIYDAGFNSSGRFYEKSGDMLGMTPSHYRAGGASEEIWFAVGQTSLGAILVASTRKGVVSILLGENPDELVRNLQDRFPKARLIGADRDYEALVARAVGFVETPAIGLVSLSTSAELRSSSVYGKRSRRFHAARVFPMLRSLAASDPRRRCEPSRRHARRTTSLSRFPAIAWSARMARSPDTRGASNENVFCSTAKPGQTGKPHEFANCLEPSSPFAR